MTRTRTILATVALAAAGVLVTPASPAAAVPYCDIALVWQNAYVPGESASLRPNCMMAQGAGPNGAVQNLQYSLRECHHMTIATDGEFGPQTKRVLTAVQSSLGIAADGVYGPQTARAMSHRIVGGGGCTRITF
jgi:peptidoglycan hydrolase-like protein with peptidoglycan-binding domain